MSIRHTEYLHPIVLRFVGDIMPKKPLIIDSGGAKHFSHSECSLYQGSDVMLVLFSVVQTERFRKVLQMEPNITNRFGSLIKSVQI